MDREALAEFLRRRREAIHPADVGLPPGVRRRTAGLRREEVAQLTGMSVDYYGRFEQARSTQPSPQMLRALARDAAVDRRRGGSPLPAGRARRPRTGRVLAARAARTVVRCSTRCATRRRSSAPTPASMLAQNQLSKVLTGDRVAGDSGLKSSMVWQWFTDPRAREAAPADEARRAQPELRGGPAGVLGASAQRRGHA